MCIPKNVHKFNVIKFYLWVFKSIWRIHLSLTWYLLVTICQNANEWNKMPTKHCFQVYFPMPTCYDVIRHIRIWVLTQPIFILVDCSNIMFEIKFVFVKKWKPICQLLSEPVRFHEPFQWLVINHQGEWVTKQITLECGHGPNDGQTFPLKWTTCGFYLFIGPTCISHHKLLVFIIKNCSKFQNTPLCM